MIMEPSHWRTRSVSVEQRSYVSSHQQTATAAAGPGMEISVLHLEVMGAMVQPISQGRMIPGCSSPGWLDGNRYSRL